ncbi:hypothetical protein TNIN_280261 [Trichonephila inaurata madagascariensis]|uniref:Uncharacterized protein n=1 Tax=Trichonephila inaurata madagascariensis TaxID=2747483 RepID=A0A8X7C3K7_9ARAC|nr:hypothetical protein TNIN_280261 [Trichonephila inaurata madagascariensis]
MKDQSGPDEPSQGGQVLMTCGAKTSSMEDKNSPERPVPVHPKEPWQLRKDPSGSDEYSQVGQVLTNYGTDTSQWKAGAIQDVLSPTLRATQQGNSPSESPF